MGKVGVPRGKYKTKRREPSKLLTERQCEIVFFLLQFKARQRTAAYLHISIHTFVSHQRLIYEKLDVHTLTELVFWARQQGIV